MNDTSDLRAIGIDFGATSVKVGALPDILNDGGNEPVVLETSSYGSVDDLIGAIAETITYPAATDTIIIRTIFYCITIWRSSTICTG